MLREVLSEDEIQSMEAGGLRWWERLVVVRRGDFERMVSELRALRQWKQQAQAEREELARLREALDVYGDLENWRGEQPVVWVGPSYLAPWAVARNPARIRDERGARQARFDREYAGLVATRPPEEFDRAAQALNEDLEASDG